MELIYVAGKYRADTEYGVTLNIRAAEDVEVRLARMGWAVICPHKNSARLGGAAPNNEWLTMDMEIISRCDAIYLMKGWRQSKGAVQEWRHAASLHLKVYEEGVREPPEV